MPVKLPETELKQRIGRVDLKDEGGEHVGELLWQAMVGLTSCSAVECQAFVDVLAVVDDRPPHPRRE